MTLSDLLAQVLLLEDVKEVDNNGMLVIDFEDGHQLSIAICKFDDGEEVMPDYDLQFIVDHFNK